MTYTVQYSKQVTSDPTSPGIDPLLLSISVTSTTGFPDQGLFVFQDNDGIAEFQGVCSVFQYQTVPLANPDPVTHFYRASAFQVTVPDSTTLDSTVELINTSLTALCSGLTRLTALNSPVTVTIP